MAAAFDTGTPNNYEDPQAAGDRPLGAGYPTFGDLAIELLVLGYEPLPIMPGQKRPPMNRWTSVTIDETRIASWAAQYPLHGIGLRTGHLAALDIDTLDPDLAHALGELAERRLGSTLLRVGLWPKRLLLYRTEVPFRKCNAGKVEWLGAGQQFVAFGLHPGTGRDYYWPEGETPLDVPLEDLPLVTEAAAHAFLAEAEALQPSGAEQRGARQAKGARNERYTAHSGPVRDEDGRVTDGRDGWLSTIAFHAVHDASDAEQILDEEDLTWKVWERFAETTDTSRPKKDGASWYAECDARAKVRDKLRLHSDGVLPFRDITPVEPDYDLPTLHVEAARSRLDEVLETFCEQVEAWHHAKEADPPKLAIRATVGLGKSRASRTHLVPLASRLREGDLPHRVLVFTATHALAEETAAAWSAEGAQVAVLRGYERTEPESGEPMCRDREAVQAAFRSGLSAQATICAPVSGERCPFFDSCAKQANRRDVAAADVVVAPYDALFSGLAFETDDIALMVIDEAVWPRARKLIDDIYVEELASEPVYDMPPGSLGRGPEGAKADLVSVRQMLVTALNANGPGPVRRVSLRAVGLTVENCQRAAQLEAWRKQDPGLGPRLSTALRQRAFDIAARNARVTSFMAIWNELAAFLDSDQAASGRLRIGKPDGTGRHRLDLRRVKSIHESLRHRPVLLLDATLREGLAGTVLRGLAVETIEAKAPHQQVRLVTGNFSKSMLCQEPGLKPEEARRRQNRLAECVDYVRWQALRHRSGRVLVVTYQAVEKAFADIANVETLHFNAVAGLDRYKDVACLVVIGRPLPSHIELEALAGGYFGATAGSGYTTERTGVRMVSGDVRCARVIRHRDATAEELRAAICDDELIQAIGRGRGVNRTAENPLEVHVLADVAPPLAFHRVMTWDVEAPDVFQRMLMAGIAVDSPADAAALHPEMFGDEKHAQKQFERSGFKRQNPMNTPYREMSLKSAAYRRTGKGRGWQTAFWVYGSRCDVRKALEAVAIDLPAL